MHVDGVDLAVERVRDLQVHAEIGEQRAERLVLAGERGGVGHAPACARPIARRGRAAHEHAAQRRAHRGHPELHQLTASRSAAARRTASSIAGTVRINDRSVSAVSLARRRSVVAITVARRG